MIIVNVLPQLWAMVTTVREKYCESLFLGNGPYWHVYTSGKDSPILFSTCEDMTFVMNVICLANLSVHDVRILAFEVMNNHVHLLLVGQESAVMEFFEFIRRKISRSIDLHRKFTPVYKPIYTLSALRNTIVYINRNGYVSDHSQLPYSYPWGTGRFYFHSFPVEKIASMIFTDERRRMFRGRSVEIPSDWGIIDGYFSPSSYCDIALGMDMFRDAHQYFSYLTKNIESYNNIAVELDDGEFLSDSEMFNQVQKILREKYHLSYVRDMSGAQKNDLARTLHYDYRSSNGQIRRVLGMSSFDVDALFPLSKKE